MWYEGIHFRTQRIDDTRYTQDCGVIGTYEGENGEVEEYCGRIQNIIKLDFRQFDMYVLDVQWFKDKMGKVPLSSIKIQENGFTTIDSTKLCGTTEESFILPSHCEQVHVYTFYVNKYNNFFGHRSLIEFIICVGYFSTSVRE